MLCVWHRSTKRQDNRTHRESDSLEAMSMINPSSASSDAMLMSNAQRFDVTLPCDIFGRPTTRVADSNASNGIEASKLTTENGIRVNKKNCKSLEQQVLDIKAAIFRMETVSTETIKREQKSREIRAEWCRLALVLDRIFFVIYLGLIILSLFILFPKPG